MKYGLKSTVHYHFTAVFWTNLYFGLGLGLWCFTPLSTIFQLYHGPLYYGDKQEWQDEFEDTKEITRIHISKKNRQHNGQKKKDKKTNNDLQNKHTKLKIE